MDWWLLRQLRAQVLMDLSGHLGDFFSREESVKLDSSSLGAEHLSREFAWAEKVAKLGQTLFFEPPGQMSARQVAASELLMHLGLLAGAEASRYAAEETSRLASSRGLPDGNSGAVAVDLASNKIPVLRDNIRLALAQYLTYLDRREAESFKPLLKEDGADDGILPYPAKTVQLSAEQGRVLEALYSKTVGHASVDKLKFRADHFEHREAIEWLHRYGYIRDENERYSVSLTALPHLAAGRHLVECTEEIFAVMRRRYRESPRATVTLAELARITGNRITDVRSSLRYMVQASWWASLGDLSMDDAPICASESVLRYGSFAEIITEVEAMRHRHSSPPFGSFPDAAPAQLVESLPVWAERLPESAPKALLREVHAAAQANLHALAAMGIRAVVDVIATELVGDQGGFDLKLKRLLEQGHVSSNQRESLSALIDAGNASAHRGYVPQRDVVDHLLEIMEALVRTHYLHPQLAERIRTSTPARKRN